MPIKENQVYYYTLHLLKLIEKAFNNNIDMTIETSSDGTKIYFKDKNGDVSELCLSYAWNELKRK